MEVKSVLLLKKQRQAYFQEQNFSVQNLLSVSPLPLTWTALALFSV